jgi:catechol 2,3-dioxygenase-like lactoylglutathione lyase family enzyme
MAKPEPKFVGAELYFDDLAKAKDFYTGVLGLRITEEQSGHFAKFDSGSGFICLERKGAESYPSCDKAVLFFEVEDVTRLVEVLGRQHFVKVEPSWAVMHDPEGHNILLLQRNVHPA